MLIKFGCKCLFIIGGLLYGTITFNLFSWLTNSQRKWEFSKYWYKIEQESFTLHHGNTIKQKDQLQGHSKLFQHQFQTTGNISVFSAYYDDRPSIPTPVVRIIGLSITKSTETLVCGFKHNSILIRVLAERYEMCENHGKRYGGFIFNCIVPQQLKRIPEEVFVTTLTWFGMPTDLNNNRTKILHILNAKQQVFSDDERHKSVSTMNERDRWKFGKENSGENAEILTMGACVPPLYGDIKLSLLIQFMELMKILGVSHFTMYKTKVSKDVEKLLNFYQDRGEVTLLEWKLPIHIKKSDIWYHGQLITIQDCLYRNLAKFNYLAFVDLDELIIPYKHHNWQDMLNFFEQSADSNSTAGYVFKSAFFDPDQELQPPYALTLLQLLQRNQVISRVRTKLIIKPEFIMEMGIHHISKTTVENMTVTDVQPSTALIHHYRSCSTKFDARMICDALVKDKHILKYADVLTQKYVDVIKKTIKLFMTSRQP